MNHSTPSAETSNPDDYCLTKATPDGSNLYYACLFEQSENKPIVIGLHALLQELHDVLVECSDPGVARIKFKWWLEELQRLQQQQARHPVTRFLQLHINTDLETVRLLQETVQSFEQFLMLQQPESLEHSLLLFKHSCGRVWRCCAMASGLSDTGSLSRIEDMAANYYFLQALRQPNTFMTETCCVLPRDHLDYSQLINLNTDSDDMLQVQFESIVSQLVNKFGSDEKHFDKDQRINFKHGLILNRLALKTAREMLRSNSRLLTMRVSLTPIRKLFIAWWMNLTLR